MRFQDYTAERIYVTDKRLTFTAWFITLPVSTSTQSGQTNSSLLPSAVHRVSLFHFGDYEK
jgi:hypothetical protein